jgi:hypothetical protein
LQLLLRELNCTKHLRGITILDASTDNRDK